MKGIKGVSARQLNELRKTKTNVWQEEYFDRIVRDEQELLQKWNYMYLNPLNSGLVEDPDGYQAFVRPDDSSVKGEED